MEPRLLLAALFALALALLLVVGFRALTPDWRAKRRAVRRARAHRRRREAEVVG